MTESELLTDSSPQKPVLSDENSHLMQRHRGGDQDAFSELVNNFKCGVYSYLTRCGVDPSARDDLFQEIFLKVHRAASSYDDARPFAPWLFTIVANTVRSYHRTKKVHLISLEDQTAEYNQSSAHDIIENRETLVWLDNALQKIPLEQREALLLTTVGELEQSEAAQILGIPVNTVKTYVRRARISLAKDLARRKAKIQHEAVR